MKRWVVGVVVTVVREVSVLSRGKNFSLPRVVYIEQEEMERYLYKQIDVWNESIGERDGYYWGFQDSHFVKSYEQWIDDDWTKHSSLDLVKELRLISDEIAEEIKGAKYEKRNIQFWDKAKEFTATTWVMGDDVTMIITEKKSHYLVEIYDATLAENMRVVFKGIWKELYESKPK